MHFDPRGKRGREVGPKAGGSLGLGEAEPVRGLPHTGNLLYSGCSYKDLIYVLMGLRLLHKSPKVAFYPIKKIKK